MRTSTFIATAVLAGVVAAAPLASAQNRQRWPSQGDGGNRSGSQQRGGGEQRSGGEQRGSGGQRAERQSQPRQAQPRDGGRAEQPRAQQQPRTERDTARSQGGRREVAPQERRAPQTFAQRNDGRDDGRSVNRYAVPRTGPTPRYRDGDRRVYVQPHRNYYVYRYPAYRYYGGTRYYGYRYYDPYFAGDFYWSNHTWRPRTYYVGSSWDYDLGKLRLDIDQRDAEVYIDGYYAGVVDDFDGRLQGLRLEAGNYEVEVALPGFVPLQFDVHVSPGRTTTYRGSLIPD